MLNKISLYFTDASDLSDDRLFMNTYNVVSETRRKKTDYYFYRKDKNLSLAAEFLLMSACRDYGIDYSSQEILNEENGKPYFNTSDIYFNLSHSEERALCVMAPCRVGCDVELTGKYDSDIVSFFCSDEELDALSACRSAEEKDSFFYRLWTLKESILKCIGLGLQAPMKSISLISKGEIIREYAFRGEKYFLFDERMDDSYQYALCVQQGRDDYEAVRKQISFSEIRFK